MADTAAHLVDRVLPRTSIRQWVLSLPVRLRFVLAYDPELTSDVLREFQRAVFMWQRRTAKRLGIVERAKQAHGGSVTFVQRFGGALNLNVSVRRTA